MLCKLLILLLFSGFVNAGCGNAQQQKSCVKIHQEKMTLPNGGQVLKEICEASSE